MRYILCLFFVVLSSIAQAEVIWEPEVRLTNDPAESSFGPNNGWVIATDSQNRIHIVWNDNRDGNPEIYYKRWNGTDWGTDTRLTNNSGTSCAPAIAVDGSDNIHVIWVDDRTGQDVIRYLRSADGGQTWSADEIEIGPSSPLGPSIAASGSTVYVFTAYGSSVQIACRHSADNGDTWSGEQISDGAISSKHVPVGAIGSDGSVHVVWADTRDNIEGDKRELYYNRFKNGAWGTEDTRLTWDPDNGSADPTISVDKNNKVHIVWHDDRDTGTYDHIWNVYYKSSPDGGTTWPHNTFGDDYDSQLTFKEDIEGEDRIETDLPSIAVDKNGGVHVIWHEIPSGGNISYAYFDGTIWTENITLGKTSTSPSVAVDNNNNIHVIWIDHRYRVPSPTPYNTEIYYRKGRINHPPVLTPIGNKIVVVGSTMTFTIVATDPDSDPLTYTATNLPQGATFANQTFSWSPTYNQIGTHQVTFIIFDGSLQDEETITITVKEEVAYEDSPFALHGAGVKAHEAISDLGVSQIRASHLFWQEFEPTKGNYIFDSLGEELTILQTAGIKMIVPCIRPISNWGGNPEAQEGSEGVHMYSGYPEDMPAWLEFVKRVVERYDGDGKDDIPGLTAPIKYWQVENEWMWQWKDTKENYIKFLKETSVAIKEADPSAKIVAGGLTGVDMFAVEEGLTDIDYIEMGENTDTPTIVWKDQFVGTPAYLEHKEKAVYLFENGKDFFDIVDVHLYKDADMIPPIAKWIKNEMEKNGCTKLIWSLENGGPFYRYTEKKHAKEVVKRYILSVSSDIEKVFWSSLCPTLGWSFNFTRLSLIHEEGWKKLAYYTYKLMAEKLEGSDWDNIGTISEGVDDIYLYKLTKQGKPIWVAWNDNTSTTKTITISGITSSHIKITEAIPNAESGSQINSADYPNFFGTETKPVPNGTVSITLGTSPVFIEEIEGAENHPPVLGTIGDRVITIGSTLTFTITATDPDNDPLTYTATSLPSGATFANQTFNWKPGSTGTYTACFEVIDGSLKDTETITIAVKEKEESNSTDIDLLYSFYAGFDALGFSGEQLEKVFKIAKEDLGLVYLKINFKWDTYEPQQGVFDWSKGNEVAGLAKKYNLSIIPFINQAGTPVWAQKNPPTSTITKDPEYYANFIYKFTERYQGSMTIKYIELENEPNAKGLWPDTPEYLADVDNAVYNKVKLAYPEIKICSASWHQPLGISGDLQGENDYSVSFLNTYLQNVNIDCFSIHDYGYTGFTQINNNTHSTQYDLEEKFRAVLDANGKSNVPIFFTEGAYEKTLFGESLGAANLVQGYILSHAKGIAKARWCQSISKAVSSQNKWGITDIPTEKYYAGYYAFKTMRNIMLKYPKHLQHVKGEVNDSSYWVEKFGDTSGKEVYVVFAPILFEDPVHSPINTPGTQTAVINIGIGKDAVKTIMRGSQSRTTADANGDITFSVNAEPVFIEVSSSVALPNVVIAKRCRNISRRGEGTEYFEKETALSGEVIKYSIMATNVGQGTAIDVIVVDNVPDGLIYIEGSAVPNVIIEGSKLKWGIAAIPPASSATLGFKAQVK